MSKCGKCETTGVVGLICDRCRIAGLEAELAKQTEVANENYSKAALLVAELAKHRWIPVEERLPDCIHHTDFYVKIDGLAGTASEFTEFSVATFRPETRDFMQWRHIKNGPVESEQFKMSSSLYKYNHITHWKPISLHAPEPEKEVTYFNLIHDGAQDAIKEFSSGKKPEFDTIEVEEKEMCEWKCGSFNWATSCSRSHPRNLEEDFFEFKFCPYCGLEIKEVTE